jgi:hypothetical protein
MNKSECYANVDQIPRVFFQHASRVCLDDSNSQHVTAYVDCSPSTKFAVLTALVAQVSYDNGDDSTNWILDSGSTHHMNGLANEFFLT